MQYVRTDLDQLLFCRLINDAAQIALQPLLNDTRIKHLGTSIADNYLIKQRVSKSFCVCRLRLY
jgi:hypothetical protein